MAVDSRCFQFEYHSGRLAEGRRESARTSGRAPEAKRPRSRPVREDPTAGGQCRSQTTGKRHQRHGVTVRREGAQVASIPSPLPVLAWVTTRCSSCSRNRLSVAPIRPSRQPGTPAPSVERPAGCRSEPGKRPDAA